VDLTHVLAGGISDEALAAAGEAALAELDPADDIHATAAYRAQLVRVLTSRVVRSAHEDALRRSA
jgi:carbon-monoxide dehydrogenase medium subunit